MKKFTLRQSRTSRSTAEKIVRAIRNGWQPGRGPVGAFARKDRRTTAKGGAL